MNYHLNPGTKQYEPQIQKDNSCIKFSQESDKIIGING